LFVLDGNPQAQNGSFAVLADPLRKSTALQVAFYEYFTTENFAAGFFLTWKPRGNTIQLPKFLAVAIPSKLILPSNIALVEQGKNAHPSG
jgi:hypothetical protein